MGRRILIIDGHPDARGRTFCHALAQAYATGARRAGHEVERLRIAELTFPLLQTGAEFHDAPPPADIVGAQQAIVRADHLLVVFPLWLGDMPALLKGFWEQTLRPGYAHEVGAGAGWRGLLRGRSVRIVITMGMPAWFYRLYFREHGLRLLRRNILGFCGMRPIRHSLIGNVEAPEGAARARWLRRMDQLGGMAR
jgi:putative NADPH-quinone reductase